MKRITSPTRISLLIIALSLTVIAGTLNLSAYLTDKKEFTGTFSIGSGETFGLSIETKAYNANEAIIPGDTVIFDPTITCGSIPCYVFVKYEKNGDFTEAIPSCWKKVNNSTYYYSEDGVIAPLPQTEGGTAFINTITFPKTAKMGDSSSLVLTAYAIQTKGNQEEEIDTLAEKAMSETTNEAMP